MQLVDLEKTLARLSLSQLQIVAFCQRWQVLELSLFGSVLREDFCPESDVDVLVEFQPTAPKRLTEWIAMQDELEALLGRNRRSCQQKSHSGKPQLDSQTQHSRYSASHLWWNSEISSLINMTV